MQKETKKWLEEVHAKIKKQKEQERAKARAELKFTYKFSLPKEVENLKTMYIFEYFKNCNKISFIEVKNLFFISMLIYTCKAFSNDYFLKNKNENRINPIFITLSDFRLLFGYKYKIPPEWHKKQKNKKTYLYFYPNIKILENLNYAKAKQNDKKVMQYKAFSFHIIMDFLNKFKAPSIPFLLYILNLYKHSNRPKIQHNTRNLLKACKISLHQNKKTAINRINKYLTFLWENGIIADEKFYPLTVADLDYTNSLNIQLKLF